MSSSQGEVPLFHCLFRDLVLSLQTKLTPHNAFNLCYMFDDRLVDDVFGKDNQGKVQMEKVMMLIWQFRDDPTVVQFMAQFVAKVRTAFSRIVAGSFVQVTYYLCAYINASCISISHAPRSMLLYHSVTTNITVRRFKGCVRWYRVLLAPASSHDHPSRG